MPSGIFFFKVQLAGGTTLSALPSLYFDLSVCWVGNSLRWTVVEPTWLPSPNRESRAVQKWEARKIWQGKAGRREVEKTNTCWWSCGQRGQLMTDRSGFYSRYLQKMHENLPVKYCLMAGRSEKELRVDLKLTLAAFPGTITGFNEQNLVRKTDFNTNRNKNASFDMSPHSSCSVAHQSFWIMIAECFSLERSITILGNSNNEPFN